MPSNGNDSITVTPGLHDGLGGADDFFWLGGAATIVGGDTGEAYDTNVYGTKTGGDRLHVEGDGPVILRLTSTEDGTATRGGDTLTFTGIERIHLGAGADIVRGGAAAIDRYGLSIWTGAGDDQINGSRAGDFIEPGEGDDIVWAGAGEDFINGSRGNDTIYGGAGNDNIRWGQGADDGNAGTRGLAYGNDRLFGGAGQDVVNLWAHNWGQEGVTVTIGKVFADGAMRGTGSIDYTGQVETARFQGFEQVWTHEGRDTLDARGAEIAGDFGVRVNLRWGDDLLTGSSGNDTLEGGHGADTITGGAGDDLISAANDYYSMSAPGDGDADTLIFREGHGHDTVLAFDVGVDVLDFGGRGYTADETAAGTLLTAGQDSILLAGIHDFEV